MILKALIRHGALAAIAMILASTAIAVAGSAITPPTAASAVVSSNDPLQLVKSGLQEAIAIFQDQTLSLDKRRAKLRDAAARYFDFAYMARSALGPHWRDLTPAQRNEFVPLFTNFIEEVYLSKVKDYSVEKVQNEVKAPISSSSANHTTGRITPRSTAPLR